MKNIYKICASCSLVLLISVAIYRSDQNKPKSHDNLSSKTDKIKDNAISTIKEEIIDNVVKVDSGIKGDSIEINYNLDENDFDNVNAKRLLVVKLLETGFSKKSIGVYYTEGMSLGEIKKIINFDNIEGRELTQIECLGIGEIHVRLELVDFCVRYEDALSITNKIGKSRTHVTFRKKSYKDMSAFDQPSSAKMLKTITK